MCLAKPISHRLGLRAIRTLLNEPYSLTTPAMVLDAGTDKLCVASPLPPGHQAGTRG